MSGGDRVRLKELFFAARALSGEERATYLVEQCGDDTAVRNELEELLQAEEQAPEFLVQPAQAPGTIATALQLEGAAVERIGKLVRQSNTAERFVHTGELAEGGMGKILEVVDTDLRRSVAMKVIRGQNGALPSGETPGVDGVTMSRFLEEAQITGQLEHSGVVPVYELGADEQGRVYFTMRRVQGQNLGEILRRVEAHEAGWTRTRVVGVLQRVCETMAFAHNKGIVHRDLKPTNVMVGEFGEVYVVDWGLARALDREDAKDIRPLADAASSSSGPEASSDREDSPLLTRDGDVLGTPAYMPPEQARGELERMGTWSDVYAVGAILYHLLVGHAPYAETGHRQTPFAILRRVQTETAPLNEAAREAPPELVAICAKAMEREPGARYPDMGAMAADLAAYVEGRVVRAHRTGALVELVKWIQRNRIAAVASAAAVLALVAGFFVSLAQKNEADAQRSEVRYERDNVLRLSAFQKLDDLRHEADDLLWPVLPERIPEYDEWLRKAALLTAGLEPSSAGDDIGHYARLEELRGRGTLTAGVWSFPDEDLFWWHGQLAKLTAEIEGFADPETGLIEGVSPIHGWGIRRRRERAEAMKVIVNAPEARRLWNEARAAIAEHPEYGGLELAKQAGLIPLGPDPDSELWEFAHLPSGAVPERAADGRLLFGRKSGVVLVLLPAGSDVPPFFLSKYELTQSQWVRLQARNPSGFPFEDSTRNPQATQPTNPVENVNFFQCQEVLTRLGLTVPTSEQWWHGARAWESWDQQPDWSAEDFEGQANFWDLSVERNPNPNQPKLPDGPPNVQYAPFDDGYTSHAPVGSFDANGYGLHDVFGNLFEWAASRKTSSELVLGGSYFTAFFRDPRTKELKSTRLGWERSPTITIPFIGVRPARPLAMD